MVVHFKIKETPYQANLTNPLDISIPLHDGMNNVNAFYAPLVEFSPVVAGTFIGDTTKGGAVNTKNIRLNPHGNGTHTECVGHISKEIFSLNKCLTQFHHTAKLVTIFPQRLENGDRVIQKEQLEAVLERGEVNALVLRTMPNDALKLQMNYSGANAPYLAHDAASYLVACGIEHLLLDLPSVDREEDEGKVAAHHAFWQYPHATRNNCTITELIYVPNTIKDGYFLLNLQITALELDASPSKPVLYEAHSKN
jgi:arylformamidase